MMTKSGLNGKLQLGDYLNARARAKIGKFRRDYAAKNIEFAPAILSVASKIHPEFLRLLWVLADIQTVKYFNLVGDEEDIGNERFKWSRASAFAIIGMRLALPLHTLQPYALICRYMALLSPLVPLLFALDQQLIVSSAAPLTSLILVSREALLQARLLSVALSTVILSLALVQVQSGGVAILRWFLACLQASFTVLLTLFLPLRRRAVVTTCIRKVKHRITAPLRVPRLAVPPLALTVSTGMPMFARMPPSFSGMPMSVRAL